MKKILFLFVLSLFVLPSIFAINVEVRSGSFGEAMIPEINHPATVPIEVTNLGPADSFQFYSPHGFEMAPEDLIDFESGQTKTVELIVFPREGFDLRGFYTFKYHIRGSDGTESIEDLRIEMVDLDDLFEIGSGEVDPDSSALPIYIHNRENINFENISAEFRSAFFEFEDSFSLGPNERKNFEVNLNKEDFKKLMAGFYTLEAEVTVEGETAEVEGVIRFAEKDILESSENHYGLIVNTQFIEKVNEGNVPVETETVVKKNIISRLFTTFSPEPDAVERQNVNVYYTWSREIPPGESLEITIKTNWLFPFIIIFLLGVIFVLASKYKNTSLLLRKRVSFVKAKGGEFALKVTVTATAREHLERVNVVDKLPHLVKIYERFGTEKPKRVNESLRRIEWDFDVLEAGETRVLSYVIYSKVGVVGKFALPEATGIYEKEGKVHETQSNKTFFISEQRRIDED